MSRIRRWLYAVGVFIAALLGAWFAGRREGRSAAEHEETSRRLEVMKEAHEVQDEVRALNDTDMRRALTRWMRDP